MLVIHKEFEITVADQRDAQTLLKVALKVLLQILISSSKIWKQISSKAKLKDSTHRPTSNNWALYTLYCKDMAADAIHQAIVNNTSFLEESGIMDYSLMLGWEPLLSPCHHNLQVFIRLQSSFR